MIQSEIKESVVKVALVIPTYNGGELFLKALQSIVKQTLAVQEKLVIDSQSTDQTCLYAKQYGFDVLEIEKNNFSHGGTRQLAVEACPDVDVVVFLTQDAVLQGESALQDIVSCFIKPQIAAAYGRQLPRENAGILEAHARFFNYPDAGSCKSLTDRAKYGIKTAFFSNSFGVYRRSCLMDVGGFPSHVILGEDTYVAAKLLLAGFQVQYQAKAAVVHSHAYNAWEECKRYFDIGSFHAHEAWLLAAFGKAEGEGLRFVCSEWRYLWKNGKAYLILQSLLHCAAKLIGYRLGLLAEHLPRSIQRRLSMYKGGV